MPKIKLKNAHFILIAQLLREREDKARHEHHQMLCTYWGQVIHFDAFEIFNWHHDLINDCNKRIKILKARLAVLELQYEDTKDKDILDEINMLRSRIVNSEKTRNLVDAKYDEVEELKLLAMTFEEKANDTDFVKSYDTDPKPEPVECEYSDEDFPNDNDSKWDAWGR